MNEPFLRFPEYAVSAARVFLLLFWIFALILQKHDTQCNMGWGTRHHGMSADVRRGHLQVFVIISQFGNSEEQLLHIFFFKCVL